MDANEYFEKALSAVESQSIRAWASSERNRPQFLKVAEELLSKKRDPEVLTIIIVSWAMG